MIRLNTLIAHSFTYAFDSYGSAFDQYGNPGDLWTEDDFQAYMEKITKLADYYSTMQLGEGDYAQCQVIAENLSADIAGMKAMLSIAATKPDFDYDTFFRAYAGKWMSESTLDEVQFRNELSPYPPENIRANMVLQQFGEFHDFYGITEGDSMYLAPEDRVQVW